MERTHMYCVFISRPPRSIAWVVSQDGGYAKRLAVLPRARGGRDGYLGKINFDTVAGSRMALMRVFARANGIKAEGTSLLGFGLENEAHANQFPRCFGRMLELEDERFLKKTNDLKEKLY